MVPVNLLRSHKIGLLYSVGMTQSLGRAIPEARGLQRRLCQVEQLLVGSPGIRRHSITPLQSQPRIYLKDLVAEQRDLQSAYRRYS